MCRLHSPKIIYMVHKGEYYVMVPKSFIKNVLDEFAYELNRRHPFLIEPGFFDFTVPCVGFAYDNSIPNDILRDLKKEGIIENPTDDLVAVLSDWDYGTKGIYFTTDRIIVRTPRNVEEKFEIKYDDIESFEYYYSDDKAVLKINTFALWYKIDINTFNKFNIMIFLKIACGFRALDSKELDRAGSIALSSLKGKTISEIVSSDSSDAGTWLSQTSRMDRMEKVYSKLFSSLDEKLLEKCLEIMERDSYCISNLPLDEDIKEVLCEQRIFRMNKNDRYIWYADSRYLDEPSILTWSVEEFKEYGYKVASLTMYPKAVHGCLSMAVTIQNLRKIDNINNNSYENLLLKIEKLAKQIDGLKHKRNKIAYEYGRELNVEKVKIDEYLHKSNLSIGLDDFKDLASSFAFSDISMSASRLTLGLGLGAAGLGSISGVGTGMGVSALAGTGISFGSAGATSVGLGTLGSAGIALPVAGLIALTGLLCWGSDRKKNNISKGIEKGTAFFVQILSELNLKFSEDELICARSIDKNKKIVKELSVKIKDLQYTVAYLENEINSLNSIIALMRM